MYLYAIFSPAVRDRPLSVDHGVKDAMVLLMKTTVLYSTYYTTWKRYNTNVQGRVNKQSLGSPMAFKFKNDCIEQRLQTSRYLSRGFVVAVFYDNIVTQFLCIVFGAVH